MRAGGSRSCGCLNVDVHRAMCVDRNTTHGQSKTRTYAVWFNMISRCHNPNARGYHKYGAKGVNVCRRWRDSYENFLADMGTIPDGMTIDRIKNERGYEPGNCRWATQKTQQNNRTNNRVIEFNGERLTVMQWSERLGIGRHTIVNRLRLGWPIEKVLSPVKHGRSGKPLGS